MSSEALTSSASDVTSDVSDEAEKYRVRRKMRGTVVAKRLMLDRAADKCSPIDPSVVVRFFSAIAACHGCVRRRDAEAAESSRLRVKNRMTKKKTRKLG